MLTEQRLALAANGAPGEVMSFTLQQVVTVPDASLPVQVRCTEMPGEALRLVEPRLTSVKLDRSPTPLTRSTVGRRDIAPTHVGLRRG